VLRLLSRCRHAHAESAVGSVAVRWLRRADLGTEEIACRTAQNLYSLHRSRQFHETGTRDPRHLNGASDISTVMPGYPSMGVNRIFGILEHGGDKGFLESSRR
jgi:hypothetical protein